MQERAFVRRLALFFFPFAVVFALPLVVVTRSWELAPVNVLAAAHRRAAETSLYGPAYGNPDRGYKFAGIQQREAPLIAVGTSRVMQFRANFFIGGESTFYNAGGVVGNLFDYRVLSRRMKDMPTRKLIVGLDQWVFNSSWAGFAADSTLERKFDGDYSALDVVQRSIKVYPDLFKGRVKLGPIFSMSDSFGVDAITYRNGFRRDGSRAYGELLAERLEHPGWRDDDVWDRIRAGTRLYEPASEPDPKALAELDSLARTWREDRYEVVVFLPPYPPTVIQALRAGGKWGHVFNAGDAVRRILERYSIPFVDYTTCDKLLDCVDDEFIDGHHGGTVLYARILLDLGSQAPWLEKLVDRDGLVRRLAQQASAFEIAPP